MTRLCALPAGAFAAALITTPASLAAQELPVESVLEVEEYISPVTANAANIQRLNIMLMVTSLRCRQTAHDFQSEYDLFATAHQQNLAEAHQALTQDMVAEHGEDGTKRALDRIGVAIANHYGDGHPTLECADLKEVTLRLAMNQDRTRLSQMADDLLEVPLVPATAPSVEQKQPTGPSDREPSAAPPRHLPHYGRG